MSSPRSTWRCSVFMASRTPWSSSVKTNEVSSAWSPTWSRMATALPPSARSAVPPLSPAGKVDRRALPAPARVRPELDDPFVDPRTPIERVVAEIWADVLALDRVGIHDTFLDLGGHSLLASQIISRVIKAVQVELPVRALFDSPTVAEMALVIVQNQARRVEQGSVERMLTELEALSDEEARKRLGEECR